MFITFSLFIKFVSSIEEFTTHTVKTFIFLFINVAIFLAKFPQFLGRLEVLLTTSLLPDIEFDMKSSYQLFEELIIFIDKLLYWLSCFFGCLNIFNSVFVSTTKKKHVITNKFVISGYRI